MGALQRGINSVKRLTAIPRTVAMQAQSWVTQNHFGVMPPPDLTKQLRMPLVTPVPRTAVFAHTVFAVNLLMTTLAVVGGGVSVTPAAATLTTTAYAPTVTATDHKTVTPTTATLTTTGYAPTVTATNINPFAQTEWANPVVAPRRVQSYESRGMDRFYDAVSVTPTTAALTTTGYAPTVTATAHQTVTPTTATLTTTGYAPTVTATGGAAPFAQADWLNPRGRAWVYAPLSHRPAGVPGSNTTVTPTTATLTLTTYAPTVTTGVVVYPFTQTDWPNPRINPRYKQQPAGGRVLGEEPFPFMQTEWPNPNRRVLARQDWAQTPLYTLAGTPISVTPTAATLTTTGYAPTVTATGHQIVTPFFASLTITTFRPTVSNGTDIIIPRPIAPIMAARRRRCARRW